jgi:hypothetical protein
MMNTKNEYSPLQEMGGPVRHALGEIKEFARQEPVAAIAAVCAIGAVIKLLPRRWLAGTASVLGTALVRPALLSLGLSKALELYSHKKHPS